MANKNPISFLLNQSPASKEAAIVDAPAFSLTKVLAAAAAVVAPIVTIIVDKAASLDLSNANWVVLAIGVLGFLAITASADVIARALASSAQYRTKAAEARRGRFVRFAKAIDANYKNKDVDVIGLADGIEQVYLLRKKDGELEWAPTSEVEFG